MAQQGLRAAQLSRGLRSSSVFYTTFLTAIGQRIFRLLRFLVEIKLRFPLSRQKVVHFLQGGLLTVWFPCWLGVRRRSSMFSDGFP